MFSVNQTLGYQAPLDVNNLSDEQTAIAIEGLNLYYQNSQALSDISMRIPKGRLPRLSALLVVENRHCFVVSTA